MKEGKRMFEDKEIKDVYTEDTKGRKYHTNIITKQKERTKEEASECTTLNLNEPMIWSEFKNLTDDLKRMYIRHLLKTYNPTQKEIYLMLECSAAHFHRCITALGLVGIFPGRSNKQTKAQKKAWITFLSKKPNPDVTPKTKIEPTPETEIKLEPTTETKQHTTIENLYFTQSGPFNAEEFIKRITTFIKDGDDCTIAINVNASKNTRPIYEEGRWGEN